MNARELERLAPLSYPPSIDDLRKLATQDVHLAAALRTAEMAGLSDAETAVYAAYILAIAKQSLLDKIAENKGVKPSTP